MRRLAIIFLLASFPAKGAEMLPLRAEHKVNQDALYRIQKIINRGVRASLSNWDRDVVIEPVIREMRFVSGGKRFLIGMFGRSTFVRLHVRIRKNDRIWEKEFFDRTNAFTGAVTVGISDNHTLDDVAADVVAYLQTQPWTSTAGSLLDPQAQTAHSIPADSTPSASIVSRLYDDLNKLEDLRNRGLITDSEFEQQKRLLMAKAPDNSPAPEPSSSPR